MGLVRLYKMKVVPAHRLSDHCRQAYYQSKADIGNHVKNERLVLDTIRETRGEDPGIGSYKLWIVFAALFGERSMPGRDSFYTLLRRYHLMLPPRKARGTVNSDYRCHKWKNLIKGFTPTSSNQLQVSDTTYIPLAGGDVCHLHLVTDAYSHKIVGWVLADSLHASVTPEALRQAIDQAVEMTGGENLEDLIHHFDHGVQYCRDVYVERLRRHGIVISMTGNYKPMDNAVAERINGIIKVERLYKQELFETIERAVSVIERYVYFCNYRRPHMSVGYKTPGIVHGEKGAQVKMWWNKRKPVKSNEKEMDTIALQN